MGSKDYKTVTYWTYRNKDGEWVVEVKELDEMPDAIYVPGKQDF